MKKSTTCGYVIGRPSLSFPLLLTPMNLQDPIHPGIYNRWVETARENARIFDEVFDRERRIPYSPDKLRTLSAIRGHIANYNQQFLTDAEMSAKPTDIDIMVTTDDVFT